MNPMLPRPLAEQEITYENVQHAANRLRDELAQSQNRQDLEKWLDELRHGLRDDVLIWVKANVHNEEGRKAVLQLQDGIAAIERALLTLESFDIVLGNIANGELLR